MNTVKNLNWTRSNGSTDNDRRWFYHDESGFILNEVYLEDGRWKAFSTRYPRFMIGEYVSPNFAMKAVEDCWNQESTVAEESQPYHSLPCPQTASSSTSSLSSISLCVVEEPQKEKPKSWWKRLMGMFK